MNVVVYKYTLDLEYNLFYIEPIVATKHEYETHTCYVLKGNNYLLFGRRLDFSIIKNKNKLIAWSLDGKKLKEFKENCRIKIAHNLVNYKKYKVYAKYIENGGIKLD